MIGETIFKPINVINLIRQNGERLSFSKNEYIYLPDDKENTIFVVDSGEVFISKMQEEGKELILKLLSKDSLFGATRLYVKNNEYGTYAKAKSDTIIKSLTWAQFKVHLEEPKIKNEMIEFIEIESERYATKMRDMLMHGKNGALAGTLIRLSNSYGEETADGIFIKTKLTNQELANMCGTTREGINRALNILKEESLISIENKFIIIHDLSSLRRIIRCERCSIEFCQVF